MRDLNSSEGKITRFRSNNQLVAKLGLEPTTQGPCFGIAYVVG